MKNIVESLYLINAIGNTINTDGIEGISKADVIFGKDVVAGSRITLSLENGITVVGEKTSQSLIQWEEIHIIFLKQQFLIQKVKQ